VRQPKPLSRRRFLLLGGGSALGALLGGAYLVSACPLSDSGICVGPCAAFLDRDGDGICDRVQLRAAQAQAETSTDEGGGQERVARSPEEGCTSCSACPFGLIDDPYPGQCARYVDENHNGFCDLSEIENTPPSAATSAPPDDPATASPQAPSQEPQEQDPGSAAPGQRVACPFGLVNDPYPGKCRRYIDENGNGICDLSEPVDAGSDPATPAPNGEPIPAAPPQAPDEATEEPPTVSQRVACPFGLVNDPYPGECPRYVDSNGNGFCDLSEVGSGEYEADSLREGSTPGGQRRARGGRR